VKDRIKDKSSAPATESHPSATGAVAGGVVGGVAGGAITGALAGGVTGPVGAAIGAAAGAVIGAMAGKSADDPTVDTLQRSDGVTDGGTDASSGAVAGGATGGMAGGAIAGSLAGGVTGPVGAAIGAAAGAGMGALAAKADDADVDRGLLADTDRLDSPRTGDAFGTSGVTTARSGRLDTTRDSDVIPVVKEELEIGKRTVDAGGVRVQSHLVEEPVRESVDLREERARVERRPVDRPASQADLDAALGERTIEIEETVERPVVQKSARVVEEVALGKEVRQKQADIEDTLRHTEVDVQRTGEGSLARSYDDYDSDFRSDWHTRYAGSGRRYEEFEPAYRFGHTLASDSRFRGRPWEDVEADARAEWARSHDDSLWDDMKDAVRNAWHRVTR
jgi:uncharacterized protein (TIGR02271 family)